MPGHGRRGSCYSDSSSRGRSHERRDRHERRRHEESHKKRCRTRSRSRSRHRSPLRRREHGGRHHSWSRSRSPRRHSHRHHYHHDSSRSRSGRRHERRRHHSPAASASPSRHERNGHGTSRRERQQYKSPESSGHSSSSVSGSGTSRSYGRSRSPTPIRQEVAPPGHTPTQDADGHLIYKPGDYIGRYEVGRTLGEGTFGKVVSCTDHDEQRQVAVKIIKKVDRYRAAAKIEVEILKDIAERDRNGKANCIHLLDSMEFHGHICLAFERLGQSLYDVLDKNGHHGYPMQQIRHISYQVASGLKFLHRIGLTHTDLKPENILFVSSEADQQYNLHLKRMISVVRDAQIKLIDFGSATYDEDHHGRIVATRHYRPIEIILELGWSHSLDMWSLGCILYELYTGSTLFQTHSNREHMAMMEEYIGKIPDSMVKKSPARRRYFHSDYSLDWDRRSRAHRFIRQHSRSLKSYKQPDNGDPDVEDLFDLVIKLLNYEPKYRYTASKSLRHRFFDMYNET